MQQKTVPVGVTSERSAATVMRWGEMMAGALIGSIPVALLFLLVENYVASLTGSVKGSIEHERAMERFISRA